MVKTRAVPGVLRRARGAQSGGEETSLKNGKKLDLDLRCITDPRFTYVDLDRVLIDRSIGGKGTSARVLACWQHPGPA